MFVAFGIGYRCIAAIRVLICVFQHRITSSAALSNPWLGSGHYAIPRTSSSTTSTTSSSSPPNSNNNNIILMPPLDSPRAAAATSSEEMYTDSKQQLPGSPPGSRSPVRLKIQTQKNNLPSPLPTITPPAISTATSTATSPTAAATTTVGGVLHHAEVLGRPRTVRFAADPQELSEEAARVPSAPRKGVLKKPKSFLRGGSLPPSPTAAANNNHPGTSLHNGPLGLMATASAAAPSFSALHSFSSFSPHPNKTQPVSSHQFALRPPSGKITIQSITSSSNNSVSPTPLDSPRAAAAAAAGPLPSLSGHLLASRYHPATLPVVSPQFNPPTAANPSRAIPVLTSPGTGPAAPAYRGPPSLAPGLHGTLNAGTLLHPALNNNNPRLLDPSLSSFINSRSSVSSTSSQSHPPGPPQQQRLGGPVSTSFSSSGLTTSLRSSSRFQSSTVAALQQSNSPPKPGTAGGQQQQQQQQQLIQLPDQRQQQQQQAAQQRTADRRLPTGGLYW